MLLPTNAQHNPINPGTIKSFSIYRYRNVFKRWFLYSFLTTRCVTSNAAAAALNICILAGSTRIDGPPRPILTDRVTTCISSALENRNKSANSSTSKSSSLLSSTTNHQISILKAKDLPLLEKPHFAYSKSQLPDNLNRIHQNLCDADAYVIITPEYNHSPCPGLMNIMNHFGSSVFSFKPSGIVSYSAGQWGGTRAAHSLRPFLSELGCLPVSAMVHIPHASKVLNEKGEIITTSSHRNDEENDAVQEDWNKYVDRMITQLEFWAEAAKYQRNVEDPMKKSPPFIRQPSDRNTPL
mmetsp:Transcript_1725/g.2279  ORF Transcript_1725/g.2279 Transcript_1725/m.2279 type:complete len:296 (-) Transcript_1725:403-1290(-)